MKLSEIGELGIIDIIRKTTKNSKLSVDRLTDDVAIIDMKDSYLLFKCDASFEGYDFPPFAKPEEISQTALAIAVSDFAAKGAKPLAIVTSLELPEDMEVDYFKRLSIGLDYHARRYGAEIVGGDISSSNRLAITPSIVGFIDKDKIMMRKGAMDGDVVAIVDYIGDYVASYMALKNKIELKGRTKEYLRKKLLQIEPQLKVGEEIAKTRKITSSIDLNDGLEKCSKEIAELNSVDIILYENKVPISPYAKRVAAEIGVEPQDFAFNFGGDLNILMTLRENDFERVEKIVKKSGKKLFRIGEVHKGRGNVFVGEESRGRAYNVKPLSRSSYEHFVSEPLYKEEFWKEVSF